MQGLRGGKEGRREGRRRGGGKEGEEGRREEGREKEMETTFGLRTGEEHSVHMQLGSAGLWLCV